jgi:PAS domain S-box-containing protein
MDSGCIRISEKARDFFGFAKDRKICTEDFLNVVHPDDRAGLLRAWEETMQSEIETSSEYRIVRPDGSVRWVLARRRPHSDAAGPARHMIGVAIDITDQKRVEEELRESENRLRGVLESTADGILGVDSNGRVIIRNSRFNEMWHIPEELKADADDNALLSHVLGQLSKPADFLRKVRALYDSYDEEIDLLHFKDGRIFERYSRPIFLPEWVMGRVWSFRDITERQRLTEISHTQSKLMEAVFDCVPGLLYLYSEDGRLIRWNKQHEYLTGYTAEELYGFAAEDWFDEEDRVTMAREFPRVFTEGRAHVELNVIHKNGARIPFFLTGVKVIIDGGAYMVGIGIDITERRLSEAALRNSQKDIQDLAGRLISAQEEELRRLSRELHDDLTQQLAVLAIEAGKLEVELGALPEVCQKISQMKDQLIRVSEDVHAISRQLHPTILDDLGLVRAIESECATLTRRENFEIVFEALEVPAAIPNDTALCLYRIVQEGLKNIIRHSNARDAEIFLRGTDNGLCLTIGDNGVGFDPAEVRHRPGLGLSSMRERVSLVCGEYSIESQPGKGTVINVCVPLAGSRA